MATLGVYTDVCLWFGFYLFYFYFKNSVMTFLLARLYLDPTYGLLFILFRRIYSIFSVSISFGSILSLRESNTSLFFN